MGTAGKYCLVGPSPAATAILKLKRGMVKLVNTAV